MRNPFKRREPAARRLTDGVRVAAELKATNTPALKAAYRRVPPEVVADILRRAGVASPRTADLSDGARRHMDGAAFLALAIARDAGFDAAAVAVSVMTDQLEGRGHHERRSEPEPEPEF